MPTSRCSARSRSRAKLRIISTAAPTADSPLGRLRARALALPGARSAAAPWSRLKSPNLRRLEWSAPEDADAFDPHASCRRIRPRGSRRAAARAAPAPPESPSAGSSATSGPTAENYWLPPAPGRVLRRARFERRRADLRRHRHRRRAVSDRAVVWVNERPARRRRGPLRRSSGARDRRRGRELAERFTIAECTFDPWRAGQIGQELEQRGIRVSSLPAARRADDPGQPAPPRRDCRASAACTRTTRLNAACRRRRGPSRPTGLADRQGEPGRQDRRRGRPGDGPRSAREPACSRRSCSGWF